MAGDWIKMRVDLADDPAVIGMALELGVDEFGIVGRLHKLWSWADKHCTDGHVKSVTGVWIDRYIGHEGFAKAVSNAGWLLLKDTGIEFPKFTKHNGESAKARVEAADRKRIQREKEREQKEQDEKDQKTGQVSQKKRDTSVTREEKRREEIKTPPIPPAGEGREEPKKKAAIALKTFLEDCKKAGVTPIPETDPVFAYADKVKLPRDFLALQWREFKDRYQTPDAKRYKAWPTVFLKSVKGNWFKLWFVGNDGNYVLTTVGQQANRDHGEAA